MLLLSASSLRRWKDCGRLYALSRVWQTRDTATVLTFGRAFHAALEQFHSLPRSRRSHASAIEAMVDVLRREGGRMEMLGDVLPEFDAPMYDEFEVAKARGLFRAYVAHEGLLSEPLPRFCSAEREFPAKLSPDAPDGVEGSYLAEELEALTLGWVGGERIVLRGYWDGEFDDGAGVSSIVEHKTTATLKSITPADLEVDEQVSAMCWARGRLAACGASGGSGGPGRVVYNVVAKPQLRPKQSESAVEYEERVFGAAHWNPADFFARWWVVRSEASLQAWADQALEVGRAIVSGFFIPRLKGSWGGQCRGCAFLPVCAAWHDDTKRLALLEDSFAAKG